MWLMAQEADQFARRVMAREGDKRGLCQGCNCRRLLANAKHRLRRLNESVKEVGRTDAAARRTGGSERVVAFGRMRLQSR